MGLWPKTFDARAIRVMLIQSAATLAVAVVGALVARAVQLPLPWMIGAMLATTIAALFKIEIAGYGVKLPMTPRAVMVPVIGVMLGSGFSPETIGQARDWWITLIGLVVFVAATLFGAYTVYRRFFRFDKATAFFASIPGGVIESAILGELAGGDSRTISLIHFCRILLVVLSIPLIMRLIYGPVGSIAIPAATLDTALSPLDVILLTGAGVAGFLGARRLGIPGAAITGPMIVSAAIHIAGFTEARPPSALVLTAQLVLGATLGTRFAGYTFGQALRAIRAAFVGLMVMAAGAAAIGLTLVQFVDETFTALILAYSPAGLAEMSLIALSLNIGVAFVATHHIARIIVAMIGAPLVYRALIDPKARLT